MPTENLAPDQAPATADRPWQTQLREHYSSLDTDAAYAWARLTLVAFGALEYAPAPAETYLHVERVTVEESARRLTALVAQHGVTYVTAMLAPVIWAVRNTIANSGSCRWATSDYGWGDDVSAYGKAYRETSATTEAIDAAAKAVVANTLSMGDSLEESVTRAARSPKHGDVVTRNRAAVLTAATALHARKTKGKGKGA